MTIGMSWLADILLKKSCLGPRQSMVPCMRGLMCAAQQDSSGFSRPRFGAASATVSWRALATMFCGMGLRQFL